MKFENDFLKEIELLSKIFIQEFCLALVNYIFINIFFSKFKR